MTARLPTPGADSGGWGDVLNTFLSVEHDATGHNLYTVAGTGAAQRTLDARFGDLVNVKDFGALGDGVTDDTAAITSTIASLPAAGGTIFFPTGTYLYAGTITIPSKTYLLGAGKKSTILKNSNSNIGIDFSGPSTSSRCSYSGAEGLEFNGGALTGTVVRAQYGDHLNFNRVSFNNSTGIGFWAIELFDSYFDQCEFTFVGNSTTATTSCMRLESSATDSTNHIYMSQCRWESYPGTAFYITDASSGHVPYAIFLSQCKMESSVWKGGAISASMISASGSVDEFHVRDLFMFAGLTTGGSAGNLINFVGRNSWQFEGIDVAANNSNAISSIVLVNPTSNNGHLLRGVRTDIPTGGVATAIVTFAGSAPSDSTNPMRIGNIGSYGGLSETKYSGTVPAGVILEDQPVIRATTQTADYTLVLGDGASIIEVNSGSGVNITIPPNASVAFPLETVLAVTQIGAGSVTYVAGAGVTLQLANGSATTSAQWATLTARQQVTDTWIIG